MELWTSGEIQSDVGDDYRKIRNQAEQAVNALFSKNDYGSGLNRWVYMAIIKAVETDDFKEIQRFNKKKKEVEFRLRIKHKDFLNASYDEKKKLFLESLLRSIQIMPEIGIKDFDFERLSNDIQKAEI